MRVSLNTVKQYTSVDIPVDQLVEKINQQLGGVEAVINLADRYKDAVIVKIVSAEQHPDADRLKVCLVDDGQVVSDIPRDENGYVQVVCGAPNARADIFAVWLPPQSIVPASYDEAEPFKLAARELRGVLSQGMLAAPDELAIGTDHDGILEINPTEPKPNDIEIKPGTQFASAYGLDDTLIDIENKMFTHRPDLFGQLGVAREIAGIQQLKFTSPEWYSAAPIFTQGLGLELAVKNDVTSIVPRFMAVAIKGIEVKPSPLWLQCELVRLGSKPINNIVDVTNYIMLLSAQPTHAYDYDKLSGHHLGVRLAREGEEITLLNHKKYELHEKDIVIVDGEGPVGLAGIMGGGDSEVSAETVNIVLEVATFDMYALRRSSMRHGLFTDALTRFNKGQSPRQNANILGLLISAVTDIAGGEVASDVYDLHEGIPENKSITITPSFVNDRLGLNLNGNGMRELLENVEFTIDGDEQLEVTAPFWRTDIEREEDVVEEVGRLYGFDSLPRTLPQRSIKPVPKNVRMELKNKIRNILCTAGSNEVLTYSFVHENILKKAEQSSGRAFKLSNALSPDLQYYRLSVLPSLLEKVHANVKSGHDEFVLFELGKGHHVDRIDEDGLPIESNLLEMIYTSRHERTGAPYYHMQRLVSHLTDQLGVQIRLVALKKDDDAAQAPYAADRSADIQTIDGVSIGTVGELQQSVRRNFKLPEYSAAATIDVDTLQDILGVISAPYRPLPRFPKVTQDISLKVNADTTYSEVEAIANEVLQSKVNDATHHFTLLPLSIYQPDKDTSRKSIALRLVIASFDRTLTDADVSVLLDAVAEQAAATIGAERT